jgi:Ca2+-binding RTX toxin-like protein
MTVNRQSQYTISWNNLPPSVATNLFLYGTTNTPLALYDKLFPAGYTGGAFGGPAVLVDAKSYMESGPGRYALPSCAPIIQEFFLNSATRALDPGSYSAAQISTILLTYWNNIDSFVISQYEYGSELGDYDLRTFVNSQTSFVVTDLSDLRFIVAEDGTHSVQNLQIRPYNDNFDFSSNSWPVEIYNVISGHNLIDPYEIGKTLQFQMDGVDSLPIIENYSDEDFVRDLGLDNTNRSGSILTAKAAANRIEDRLIESRVVDYEINGFNIVFGKPGADVINENTLFARKVLMLGGGGKDLLDGGSYGDRIYGHEGDDSLRGNGGDDRLFGGSGNDTLIGGAGYDLLVGDFSKENYLGAEEINAKGGDDRLYGGDQFSDDGLADRLEGGNGNDKYFVGDKDVIYDSDGKGSIDLDGKIIKCKTTSPPPIPGGQPVEIDGVKYSISKAKPNDLIVTVREKSFVIENWKNKDLRIEFLPTGDRDGPGDGGGPTGPLDNWGDPIILDLDGDGLEVSSFGSLLPGAGQTAVYFDIDNDGLKEFVNWVGADDGLLAFDADGNGVIDNASELFGAGASRSVGEVRQWIANGIGNPASVLLGFNDYDTLTFTSGFEQLALFDANHDGAINAADGAFYDSLKIWRDLDQDGVSTSDELFSLAQAGVASISLGAQHILTALGDNQISDLSTFTTTSGDVRVAADIWLRFDASDTRYDRTWDISAALQALPDITGNGNVMDLRDAAALDPALQQLLQEFDDLGGLSLGQAAVLANSILLRWAGVADTEEVAFGRGGLADGRHLAVFEAFRGTPVSQWGSPNPRALASYLLENEWQDLYQRVFTYLVVQTDIGAQLIPEVSFPFGAFLQVDEGTTIETVIDRIEAASANLDFAAKFSFLYGAASLLEVIHGAFVDVAAAAQPRQMFIARMQALLDAAGIHVAYQDFLGAQLGGESGGEFITASRFRPGVSNAFPAGVVLTGASDDHIRLGDGKQIVFFGAGAGDDTILNAHAFRWNHPNVDRLEIRLYGLNLDDVTFSFPDSQIATDLRITVKATGETLTIYNFVSSLGEIASGVVMFADGTSIRFPALLETVPVGAATAGDDVISRPSGDTDGGLGNDLLIGGTGDNVYHFGPDSGVDTIIDLGNSATDQLVFASGLTIDDLVLSIDPTSGDLRISLISGASSVTIDSQYAESDGTGIEQFVFGDGTILTAEQIRQVFINRQIASGETEISGTPDGDSIVLTEPGNYVVHAFDGNDTVTTLGGHDFIYGGDGDDSISVGAGDDFVDAGYGNDTIDAGAGDDLIRGGGGDDTYIVKAGTGFDYFEDASGINTVVFEGLNQADVSISVIKVPVTEYVPNTGDFPAVLGYDPVHSRFFDDASSSNTRRVFEQFGLQVLLQGGAAGTLWFSTDPSSQNGFSGISEFRFEDGTVLSIADILAAHNAPTDADQDIIGLPRADDVLNGGGGSDNLFGYGGNNTLTGGTGNDVLLGENGTDTYVINLGDGVDIIDDYGGANRIVFGAGIAGGDLAFKFVDFDYSNVAGSAGGARGSDIAFALEITIGSSGQKIFVRADRYESFAIETLQFHDGSQLSVADILPLANPATGEDQILLGYHTSDVLNGGAGNDRIFGYDGNDTLSGGGGNDVIFGGGGADVLSGEAGDDVIHASGSSTVIGGADNDILIGTSDLEKYYISSADGNDVISDENAQIFLTDVSDISQVKFDIVELSGFLDAEAFDAAHGAYVPELGYRMTFLQTGSTVLLTSIDLNKLTLANGTQFSNVQIRNLANLPTNADQILVGNLGVSNTLSGGAGNDEIVSLHRYDSDVFAGTHDTFNGGAGSDTLRGGIGDDTYIYNLGDGSDRILEAASSVTNDTEVNRLVFGNGIAAADLRFTFKANPEFGNTDSRTGATAFFLNVGFAGSNETIQIFTAGDSPENAIFEFAFANGAHFTVQDVLDRANAATALADILISRQDINTLSGGAGNDQIIAGKYGSSNSITGGSGNDEISLEGFGGTNDLYWNSGDGTDTLSLKGTPEFSLHLGGTLAEADVSFTSSGSDIILRIKGQSAIVIKGAFDDWQAVSFNHISSIQFAVGGSLTSAEIVTLLHTAFDVVVANPVDVHLGTDSSDVLDGGDGFDDLQGGLGNDSYVFGLGYAEDVISDSGGLDTISFKADVISENLAFTRIGNDLLIEIDGLDRNAIRLKDQFLSADSRIEKLAFTDGSVWTWAEIQADLLARSISEGADTINDFVTSDVIKARGGDDSIFLSKGNDLVDGGDGRDIVHFVGLQSDYAVSYRGANILVSSNSGEFGTKTLTNIETLVFDGDGSTGSGSTVNLVTNLPPVALNPSFTLLEDGRLRFLKSDLLKAAASDPDSGTLNISALVNAIGGTILISDHYVDFVAAANFNGIGKFDVVVSDGIGSVVSTVTVNVTSVNDAPVVVVAPADQVAIEDSAVSFLLPTNLFADIDGDALVLSASVSGGEPLPSWLSFNAAERTFTGTPPADFDGVLQITVSVSDGHLTAASEFLLSIASVNDAPVLAQSLVNQSGFEDTGVDFVLPAGAFTDVDGDDMTLSAALASGTPLPSWLAFNAATRAFSGTPPLNFNGVLLVTVKASDGSLSASDQFALTINPINDAPTLALPLADMSALEDNAVSFVLPASSFTDVDSPLSLSATLADGSALPAWLSFDATTQTFSGVPPLDFNGVLQVTVTASDGSLSVSDQFALIINPVNDAPVLALPLADVAVLEDSAVSFVLPANSFTDVDNTLTLSATLADGSSLPAWLSFDATTRTLSGTPPLNFNGVLQVTVTATDGSLSASDQFALTITPVNDAPVLALPLADMSALEDNAVSFVLPAGSFTDVDSALTLSAKLTDGSALPTWLSFNAATRAFSGTPPLNFNGVLQVVVTASDGSLSASDQFALTIAPVNDAPVLALPLADMSTVEDNAVSFVLPQASFTDVDGDALTLSAKLADGGSLPSWLSFNASTRTFSGTPPLNFNGVLQVIVTASDGSLSASDQLALTITPVNDAPVLALPLADMSALEDNAVSFVLPTGSFTDVDSALALSATLADGSALPAWLSFNAVTRTFSGTPPLNFNGVLQVVVTASDGSLSTSDQFALTITPVNDAPVLALPLADQNGAQGQPLSFAVPANAFTDVDSSQLSFTAAQANGTALPSWLAFNAATRTFSGTPSLSFSGVLQIVVTASDGALSASDQLALTIAPAVVDPYAGWVKGTAGNDLLLGSLSGPNQIYGDAGNDVLTGGLYDDKLDGGSGDDILWGLAGNDVLSGNAGNDFLYGDLGNDRIIGGLGKDVLGGGLGNDVFVFATAADSGITVAARDQIIDFTKGQDKIDLSLIDANPMLSGDQAFTLLANAAAAFTGAPGQLRWLQEDVAGTVNDNTIIVGDINGDKIADFQIEIDGLFNLKSSDFVL